MSRLALAAALASAAVFSTAASPVPAVAADSPSICGARAEIVTKLSSHYQELPAAVGMVDKDAVLEVFVSNNGTWTIIATGTDGNSCVLSSGEGWQSTQVVAGKDA